MSHFTKIKTTLKDLTVLKKSLTDLSVQWEAKSQVVKGYKDQTTFANLVIKQNNNYDIGFAWNGFEYQLVAERYPVASLRGLWIALARAGGGLLLRSSDQDVVE